MSRRRRPAAPRAAVLAVGVPRVGAAGPLCAVVLCCAMQKAHVLSSVILCRVVQGLALRHGAERRPGTFDFHSKL